MKIVFRVDASPKIGAGHITRCLTLADSLSSEGAHCEFICSEHLYNLKELILARGFCYHSIPTSNAIDLARVRNSLSGIAQLQDAEACISVVARLKPDWLVVDHYALDSLWERALSPYCRSILVIDDLADRPHDCRMLLDQSFGSSAARYAGLLPKDTKQLHGPRYALLKPAYAERRVNLHRRSGSINRALVYFGGGLHSEYMTGLVLQVLSETEFKHIEVDIVLSATSSHGPLLEAEAKKRGGVNVHIQLPDLSGLMAKADLAVGAGGATTWERCCMGLTSLIVSVADNQRAACEALATAGLIDYLGHVGSVDFASIRRAIHRLSSEYLSRREQAEACQELVDGKGTERVMKILFEVYSDNSGITETI